MKEAGALATRRNQGAQPTIIFVILPDVAANICKGVKQFGDILFGVPMQCVVSDFSVVICAFLAQWELKQLSEPRSLEGWMINIATMLRWSEQNDSIPILFLIYIHRVNVKLGGVNSISKREGMSWIGSRPTMVVGKSIHYTNCCLLDYWH